MASSDSTRYLHGSSDLEQSRLELMNRILNERELAAVGLSGGERILELGAGTALFARAMAEAAPAGSVVAVERDERQFGMARRVADGVRNLEVRRGDAYRPPLAEEEWGSFDVVHARFLLEHVERPLDVVRVMVRAVRPGGRIVLVDDDHALMQLWPEPEGFLELWRAYEELYVANGTDPFVGRKLVSLLAAAGARPVRASMVFYGGAAGEPGFLDVVENLAEVFEGVEDPVVGRGACTREEFEAAVARFRAWGRRADGALWYALPLAEGTR